MRARMPRLRHEALVHLVRTAPEILIDLIGQALSIAAPMQVRPRTTAGEFVDLDHAEFRADAVLTVGDPVAQVFIVEAQGEPDPQKRLSWPIYAAGAHARWGCPVLLVILAPSRRVARWARRPIDVGHGRFVLHPLVLDADVIPWITDAAEARRSPELAVLSVMAHGHEPGAERIGLAALDAARTLDSQRALLYPDFVHALLGRVARAALEKLMNLENYQFQSPFFRKLYAKCEREATRKGRAAGLAEGKAEGLAEGLAEGQAAALLALLRQKGFTLEAATRERIAACRDLRKLKRWLARVLDARSLADVFGKSFT